MDAADLASAPWKANGNGHANGHGRRFQLVPFDKIELAEGASYLVKGLIPREGLIVVWGAPKCGKTFWTFDLAMHVALGWEYRGRRVTQGPVVYVACEGERGLAARAKAFRLAKMAGTETATPFYLLTTRLDLAAEVDMLIGDVRAQVPGEGCAAIVVDTLNRSIGGSESKDEDMGAYIRAADAIREAFRCAVIVIHHCGLDDKRPRGHTSLAGAADAQIAVKRESEETVAATVEYMKDGEGGAVIRSDLRRVELGQDVDGDPLTSLVVDAAEGDAPPKQRRPPKVPPAAKQALALLVVCMETGAVRAPVSDHIPAGVRGVTKAVWRAYLEKGGIINPEGNPREQLRRIIVTLKDAGLIGLWDDFVWPVTSRHMASQWASQ